MNRAQRRAHAFLWPLLALALLAASAAALAAKVRVESAAPRPAATDVQDR